MYIATPDMEITVVRMMLLPSGRWLIHYVRALCVADVIARWRLKPTRVEVGKCNSQVADGMAIVLF